MKTRFSRFGLPLAVVASLATLILFVPGASAFAPASVRANGSMTLRSGVGGSSLGELLSEALVSQVAALRGSVAGGAVGGVGGGAGVQVAPVQLVDDSALSLTIGDGDARPLLVSEENDGKDEGEGRRSGKVVILAQYN